MLSKCFESEGGQKRFRIVKEATDPSDLGSVNNSIKMPVTQYIENLDDAIAMWDGIAAINFYTTKENYNNDFIHYTLNLVNYDRFMTLREAMMADNVLGIEDPITSLYISYVLDGTLIDGENFEASIVIDNLVSDHVVVLAESIKATLEQVQTLTASNTGNHALINQHLQSAVDELNGVDGGHSPLMSENHSFQR